MNELDMTNWTDREKALYAQSEGRLILINKLLIENERLSNFAKRIFLERRVKDGRRGS
jgi:hypothetical protein